MVKPRKRQLTPPPRGERGGLLAEELTQRLAEEIIEGRLVPGARLDEQEMAARFTVSRTPVREAFSQLLVMGLVERRPNRGVIVASPSPERLAEMFAAMAELEAAIARLAALAMSSAERHQLAEMHEASAALVRAGALEDYAAFNVTFHNALYAGAHNTYLHDLTVQTRRRLAPFRRAQFNLLGRLAESWQEHDAVVVAILRGDADGAASAVRRHVATVATATTRYVGTRRDTAAE